MATHQVAPTMCPNCGMRFTAPIQGIIDVGDNPALKARILQGDINVAKCPQCGNQGAMVAPLLYHDPAHELALVLMPQELNLHNNDQQRMIGDLTNRLMNNMPPEQRKAYLLTPKIFLTRQSLVNAILEAEGITPEMIERQQAKAQLIDKFLRAEDEATLRNLVTEHDAELDYEFFQFLTASAQSAHADGQTEVAQALLGLRSLLAEWSSGGQAAVAEVDASLGLGETITREELLERLLATQSDEEFETLVAASRPLLDYAFFQNLTAQIESAQDANSAAQLKALRSKILDTTAKQDEEARATMQQAAKLLSTILQADDPQATAQMHLDQINDAFFMVLSANIQQAEAENRKDIAHALRQVADMVFALLEDRLPADIRLLNQLLRAPYPDGTRQLLEAQRGILTPDFMVTLDRIIADLNQSGRADASNHMTQVKSQADLIVQSIPQT